MALFRRRRLLQEDIVSTSMSELILFFLFFFLILLGSVLDFEIGDGEDAPRPTPRPDTDSTIDIVARLRGELAGLRIALVTAEQQNRILNEALEDANLEIDELVSQNLEISEDVDRLIILRGDAQSRLRDLFINFDELVGELTPEEPGEEEQPETREGNPEPFIVTLSSERKFNFDTDSSTITNDFRQAFNDEGRADILQLLRDYDGEIEAIEVIGHTDEEIYDASDLDGDLLQALNGDNRGLTAVDNAGLGLARAVSTAAFLREELRAELDGIEIIPLSAAFLQGLDGRVIDRVQPTDEEDDSRRRIEIRIRSAE